MAKTLTLQIEDLLAEHQWLVQLSRHLVADTADAEDVVQETMIRALRQPSGSAPERLRGWLAATARNIVFEGHRGKGRRIAREMDAAVHETEGFTSPEEALLQTEFRARLARFVMDLDEAERTAVSMKFYGGLGTMDIAERTGVQAHTVRQRISRGVARLRERLTHDEADGGGVQWLAVAAGIARNGVPGPTKVGAATTLGQSSIFQGPWLAFGLAATVAALAYAVLWLVGVSDGRIGDRPGASPRAVDPHQAATEGSPQALTVATDDGGAARLRPAAFTPTPGRAWVQLIDPRTQAPAEGVSWVISPTGEFDSGGIVIISSPMADPYPIAAGRTGPNGVVDFIPPGEELVQLITLRSERYARGSFAIALDGDEATPHIAQLSQGATVRGRAVDDRGTPVQGIYVGIHGGDEKYLQVATTDTDGRFEVPCITNFPRAFRRSKNGDITPGRTDKTTFALAWPHELTPDSKGTRAPGLSITDAVVDRNDATPHDLGDIVMPRPRRYVGQVVDARNRPAPGALVGISYKPREPISHTLPATLPGSNSFILPQGKTVTDSDGRFDLPIGQSAKPGRHILATSAFNSRTALELPRIGRGETYGPLTLQLPDSESLEIRLRDEAAPPGDLSWFWSLSNPRVRMAVNGLTKRRRPKVMHFTLPLTRSGSVHVVGTMLKQPTTRATLFVSGFHPYELDLADASGAIDVPLTRIAPITVELTVEEGHQVPWMDVKLSALPPRKSIASGELQDPSASLKIETRAFTKRIALRSSTLCFPDPLAPSQGTDQLWVYAKSQPAAWRDAASLQVFGPFERGAGPLEITLAAPLQQSTTSEEEPPQPVHLADTPIVAVALSAATGRALPGAVLRSSINGIERRGVAGIEGQVTVRVTAAQATFTLESKGHRSLQFGPLPLREGVTIDLGKVLLQPLTLPR